MPKYKLGLEHLLSESIKRGETFERKFKNTVIEDLDVFEDFGVAEVRKNISKQSLDVAFVHLDFSFKDRQAEISESPEEGDDLERVLAKRLEEKPKWAFTFDRTATSVEAGLVHFTPPHC